MDCYSYKVINTTNTPILKNVDVVLILAMEGSTRFKEDQFLLNLTKKTIVQYNKGFRKCNKPSTIISSKQDLVHAYYTAFDYLKEYNNVIILEDDAFVVNKNILIYEKIDAFIATTNFDIFTFGSFSFELTSKYNEDFLKLGSRYFFGGTQAIIYSRDARSKLIEDISSTNFNKGHFDKTYIVTLTRVFTYKYPLIIQLFPKTENRELWVDNIYFIYIINFLIPLVRLDTNIYSWFVMYFIHRNYISIISIIIIIIILIISILYFKMNNNKIVKNITI
jgi:hypothetical protein